MNDRALLIGLVLLLAAAGVGAALFLGAPEPAPPPKATSLAVPDAGVAPPVPTVVDAGIAEAPSPAVSPQKLLRRFARKGKKPLPSWAAAPGAVQRITAGVRLVAQGRSPRSVLSFIEVDGRFEVVEEGPYQKERTFIAKASYRRYDRITDALTSLDTKTLARAYRRMSPHFEAAYAQVAAPGEKFDDVLSKAIGRITAVEFPKGRIELIPEGAIYRYKDPALEEKSEAEKHLLRMGPKNGKRIQKMLRDFDAAR